MKNIFVLPTDKQSRLYHWMGNDTYKGEFRLRKISGFCDETSIDIKNQHIYITNDEEIKEGDYGLDTFHKEIRKFRNKNFVSKYDKKIILTTDQDLINDGVQAIDDELLEWIVNNPSCESVKVERLDTFKKTNEVYVDEIAGGNYYEIIKQYKIIIPQEEPEQETTLEEAYLNKLIDEANKEFTLDRKLAKDVAIKYAKWQQEQDKKMYSEKEMLDFSEWVSHNDWVYLPSKGYWVNEEQEELEENFTTKELFEQFKNK
jgi:hypothetical protein